MRLFWISIVIVTSFLQIDYLFLRGNYNFTHFSATLQYSTQSRMNYYQQIGLSFLLILHFNITISRIFKAAFRISHTTLSSFTLSRFCRLPCWSCTDSMVHRLVTFIQNDEQSLPPHDMNTHLTSSSPSESVQLVYISSYLKCGHNSSATCFVSKWQLHFHLHG